MVDMTVQSISKNNIMFVKTCVPDSCGLLQRRVMSCQETHLDGLHGAVLKHSLLCF